MSVVPSTHTFRPGPATSDEMNLYVRDPIRFLLAPPIAKLVQTVAQTYSTGVSDPIQFNGADIVDTTNGHDPAVNNTKWFCTNEGWHLLFGMASFANNATGDRGCVWQINGGSVDSGQSAIRACAGIATRVPAITLPVYLVVGDYVELEAFQSSGGNLASIVTTSDRSGMSVYYLGK